MWWTAVKFHELKKIKIVAVHPSLREIWRKISSNIRQATATPSPSGLGRNSSEESEGKKNPIYLTNTEKKTIIMLNNKTPHCGEKPLWRGKILKSFCGCGLSPPSQSWVSLGPLWALVESSPSEFWCSEQFQKRRR